jgi:hypothetical protein
MPDVPPGTPVLEPARGSAQCGSAPLGEIERALSTQVKAVGSCAGAQLPGFGPTSGMLDVGGGEPCPGGLPTARDTGRDAPCQSLPARGVPPPQGLLPAPGPAVPIAQKVRTDTPVSQRERPFVALRAGAQARPDGGTPGGRARLAGRRWAPGLCRARRCSAPPWTRPPRWPPDQTGRPCARRARRWSSAPGRAAAPVGAGGAGPGSGPGASAGPPTGRGRRTQFQGPPRHDRPPVEAQAGCPG